MTEKKKAKKREAATNCDSCVYYDYNEEDDMYECRVDLDEDEFYRAFATPKARCPYYRQGDDYTLARRQ